MPAEPLKVDQPFPALSFQGELRPTQQEVDTIARQQLSAGRRRLHIVAPPGSGKTILGLHLWACRLRCPALVLSPNSAIQAQWAARTSLFRCDDDSSLADRVSLSAKQPRLLTSLTYQSITLPARASEKLDARALDLWIQTILEQDQAESSTAAEIWVNDLKEHNAEYFDQRLAHYRKRVRDDDAQQGQAMTMLHDSCVETLKRLRDRGIGLLILDECHHLMGHWGRVLWEVSQYLGDPVVLGLTATPPDRDGRSVEDVERYDKFFGEVDYEVPVPAIVKDGFLAPYQDLAYFVRPTPQELTFIARADDQFDALLESLCRPHLPSDTPTAPGQRPPRDTEPLPQWIERVLRDRQLPTQRAANWRKFHARDPEFAEAAVWFMNSRNIPLPPGVPQLPRSEPDDRTALITLIDRYTRHQLRRSPHPDDRALAETAVQRLRMLGIQITDTGHRPCASPVSRVIAYTRSKTLALVPILSREMGLLGEQTRAVVIADYEKTSAITAEIEHLLDQEAGGAVAAFRALLDDPQTNQLDPVLVTGSTVLVDADLVQRFMGEATSWLRRKSMNVELNQRQTGSYCVVTGSGSDWSPRVYVEMITDLFQAGTTRCLVGTRGLLGEGWDANKINVLVDLSTATTSMTVNQLRGRSIRLDPDVPDKLANNWDVVCIAPESCKGLDDYHRFKRKHQAVFGICDDGAIERGVGHVHAAFTNMKPELLDGSVTALNEDMLRRAGRRQAVYRQWEIGKPYRGQPIRTVEVRGGAGGGGFPPFDGCRDPWAETSLAMAVGQVVLACLIEMGELSGDFAVQVSPRDGGFVRIFLDNASSAATSQFTRAVSEALGPLDQPRYVIPRYVDQVTETFLSKWLPNVLGRLFERRDRELVMLHAVPSQFAGKRSLVNLYQKHWNRLVSPGEAVYAKNDKGQHMIDQAVQHRQLPDSVIHDKEVFR
ncbi:MAG: DEAD/DEAH box helicase family protein [Pirellulales bacterium]|nr:DEAD/DEAH box helicase family protein [Pirellulales bacterium]